MKKFLLALLLIQTAALPVWPAEKAIPVMQSTYNYMKFYVYKPANLPKGFYVTFDGYIIYTARGGVWKYASAESSGIVKTSYVVGAVVPSTLNIKPYNKQLSSASPVLETAITNDTSAERTSMRITSVDVIRVSASSLSSGAGDWTQNPNFMALSKWQKSVDRIGVISSPALPVAWTGDYPEVIYVWTGTRWDQINARASYTSAMSTLRRGLYDMTVYANKAGAVRWTDNDTYMLSQYASLWGYKWLGIITLERSY